MTHAYRAGERDRPSGQEKAGMCAGFSGGRENVLLEVLAHQTGQLEHRDLHLAEDFLQLEGDHRQRV